MHVAGLAGRDVELGYQRFGFAQAGLARGAQQQGIRAGIRLHRDLERRVRFAERGRIEQLLQQRGEIENIGVLQLHDVAVLRRRTVHAGDDGGDAFDVIRIVGHHQRVVAWVGGDRVVGRNERAQHTQQVVRRFMVQLEYLGDDLIAADHRAVADIGRHTLQLRVGLGHDLHHAMVLQQRKTLHAQRGLQRLDGFLVGHRLIGDQVELTFDARVDDDGLPRGLPDCFGNLIDVGIDEVQRHLRVGELHCRQRHEQQAAKQAAEQTTKQAAKRTTYNEAG